jgi:hypothetical protein
VGGDLLGRQEGAGETVPCEAVKIAPRKVQRRGDGPQVVGEVAPE